MVLAGLRYLVSIIFDQIAHPHHQQNKAEFSGDMAHSVRSKSKPKNPNQQNPPSWLPFKTN